MITLLRSNSIISDSRVQKYLDFFKRKEVDYQVVGWNRIDEDVQISNSFFYVRKSGYNVGGFHAVKDRLHWMKFIVSYLRKHKKEITVIHACDLDTAFPASIFKYLFSRNVKIIFDVFDWFTDTLNNQNILIRIAFKLMERISVRWADEIIICEPERIKQIPYKLNKKELIFPNIPSFSSYDFLQYNSNYHFNNDLLTFAYVGGFVDDRCLNELFQLAENRRVNLLLAGFGSQHLVEKCRWLDANLDNVKYLGKVAYSVGLNIMYNADLIYAMYSKVTPNNVFAAPNKYYEAMLLGKAIISTKGIILEPKIMSQGIGYVVDESYDAIENLVSKLDREEIKQKSINALNLWNKHYKDYTCSFLNEIYYKLIS